MNSIIHAFKFDIINTKLVHSYNLAHGNLTTYSSVLVTIILENGRELSGEVTPLDGYTDETMPSIMEELSHIQKEIHGLRVVEAIKSLETGLKPSNSFVLSAVLPPLEAYRDGYHLSDVRISFSEVIYALALEEKTLDELEKEIEEIRLTGHNTVKVKVGKDFVKELEWIELLSKVKLGDLRIRFDANCGYNLHQSLLFLDKITETIPQNTEYLEQPLCRSCWHEMGEIIKRHREIPIMIDESIYSIEDIQRSHDIGAQIIKLKLCKFGSLNNLQRALDYAKSLNLKVVFGNGVATDIANCYEILFYKQNKDKIYGAIESVGFLKLIAWQKFKLLEDIVS